METRKLQKVGGGTYTVSVPKEWAIEHSLEAGETVNVFTHTDGSVVLRSDDADGGRLDAVEIRLPESDPDTVSRALRAAVTAGFDRVTLHPPEQFSTAQRRAARDAVTRYVGTEIVAADDERITVRTMLDAADVSIRQSVVQLRFVARSTQQRALAALTDGESVRDPLSEREAEAARLRDMIARHCQRSLVSLSAVDRLGTSRSELFDACLVARNLHRVVGLSTDVARTADTLSGSLPQAACDGARDAAEATKQTVDDAVSAVLDDPDREAALNVLDRCDAVRTDLDAVETALFEHEDWEPRPETAAAAARLFDALDRTLDHAAGIARTALRAAIRDEDT